ncbi:MAG: hypothetical protein WDZ65_01995, partial [Aquisalimonadaceae bacterium]
RLDEAERARRPVPKVTLDYPGMDMEDAYAVQRTIRALKESRGVLVPGYKIGLTSTVKMRPLGVTEPLYGFLTDYGRIADGGEVRLGELIGPRVEMELAFVTCRDLRGPDCDVETVLDATAYVSPAMEILDSRYETSPFDVVAGVADNMSTARYVLGTSRLDPRAVDLALLGAVLRFNDEVVATGAGAAVLGNPAASLAWLVSKLWEHDGYVPAGSVVLTGGFSDALPVAAGDRAIAQFAGVGRASCRFV